MIGTRTLATGFTTPSPRLVTDSKASTIEKALFRVSKSGSAVHRVTDAFKLDSPLQGSFFSRIFMKS